MWAMRQINQDGKIGWERILITYETLFHYIEPLSDDKVVTSDGVVIESEAILRIVKKAKEFIKKGVVKGFCSYLFKLQEEEELTDDEIESLLKVVMTQTGITVSQIMDYIEDTHDDLCWKREWSQDSDYLQGLLRKSKLTKEAIEEIKQGKVLMPWVVEKLSIQQVEFLPKETGRDMWSIQNEWITDDGVYLVLMCSRIIHVENHYKKINNGWFDRDRRNMAGSIMKACGDSEDRLFKAWANMDIEEYDPNMDWFFGSAEISRSTKLK